MNKSDSSHYIIKLEIAIEKIICLTLNCDFNNKFQLKNSLRTSNTYIKFI